MQTVTPIAYRIPDACRMLGVGRSTIYDLFAAGELTPVKLNRSTLVDADELRSVLKRRLEAARSARQAA